MNELELINKYIKPIVSKNSEAMGLTDDVAVITKLQNKDYVQVITTDCMIEDIHFFKTEHPKSIAYRLIICNLSDLVAKGVTPKYFTLTFCPKNINEIEEWWLESFFGTIDELQSKYNIKLIGGNTVSTNSKLMFSITLIGESDKYQQDLPYRFKAKVNDEIYVNGFLGEAYLGYCIIASEIKLMNKPKWLQYLDYNEICYLVNKYHYPQISLELGQDLLQYANACTDASDGIANSILNICNSSNTSSQINLTMELFSSITQKIISLSQDSISEILTKLINWGGDYNLVFTIPEQKILKFKKELVKKYKQKYNLNINYLGKINTLNNNLPGALKVLDINGNTLEVNATEYCHK